jgi:hypothetical protein
MSSCTLETMTRGLYRFMSPNQVILKIGTLAFGYQGDRRPPACIILHKDVWCRLPNRTNRWPLVFSACKTTEQTKQFRRQHCQKGSCIKIVRTPDRIRNPFKNDGKMNTIVRNTADCNVQDITHLFKVNTSCAPPSRFQWTDVWGHLLQTNIPGNMTSAFLMPLLEAQEAEGA